MAGAAVAVALVAVGVPTAVGSLSAHDRPDVAAPTSTPAAIPSGLPSEDAGLRRIAPDLAADLDEAGPVAAPDASLDYRCPDVAPLLSEWTGLPIAEDGSGTTQYLTTDGCRWTTDSGPLALPKVMVRLVLSNDPRATAASVVLGMESAPAGSGCRWTSLPVGTASGALQQCSAGGTSTGWTVTMLDADGTGAWILEAGVGSAVPERYDIALSAMVALWRVVHSGLQDGPSATSDSGIAAAEEMAERVAEAAPNLSLASPSDGATCPEAPDLARFGIELRSGGTVTAEAGCVWSAVSGRVPGTTPVMAALHYYAEALPPVRAILCPSAPLPGSATEAVVEKACGSGASGAWTLTVPESGGGGWVFSVAGNPEDPLSTESTLLELLPALVQATDETW